MHLGEEQELKQETTAVPACYVPACLKKKHNARKAVWFTKAAVIGAISAFVDGIDSHIILRMILESKIKTCLFVSSIPLLTENMIKAVHSDASCCIT